MTRITFARRAALVLLLPLLAGCATSGFFGAGNLTNVELSSANYRVVATDVAGEAEAGYLFGITAGFGPTTQTLAIARVSGTGMLYREALADLWRNFEQVGGAVANRTLALVNIRFDSDALNLLVYTRPRISVRADVVEFIE